MAEKALPITLVRNERQARKVRWICWGSLVWAAGWLVWAADLAQTYGLAPGDGGMLRPAGERFTAAAILMVIGVLPSLGMMFYVRRYVVAMVRRGAEVDLVLAGFFSTFKQCFPIAAFGGERRHHGYFHAGGVTVNAPWVTLRIAGARYFVDLQAESVDEAGIAKLIREGSATRR